MADGTSPRRRPSNLSPMTPLLAIGLFFLLREGRAILLPVAAALVLTFVLAPLVRRMHGHGIPEAVGAALVVASLMGALGMGAAALSDPAARWIAQAPAAVDRAMEWGRSLSPAWRGVRPASDRPTPVRAARAEAAVPDPLGERLAREGVALTRALVVHVGGSLVSFASTVVLLYFLLASEHWLLLRSVEAVPGRRERAMLIGSVRAAQRDISHYLATMSLINATLGLLLAVCLAQLGLPSPLLWGAVAAVFNFVPYIGPVTVAALLLLAGVQTWDAGGQIFGPVAVFGGLHFIEASLVTPWLVGRRLALSSISVVLSVMFWGWLWGVGGALIAVPVLIGIRSVCKRYRRFRFWCAYLDAGARETSTLRSLLRFRRRSSRKAGSNAAAAPAGGSVRR